jgi:hypothetical protein
MANITPISGKNGKITFASNVLYLEKWEIDLKIEFERFKHFGMSADSTNLTFSQIVDGFAEASGTASGKFDGTAAAYLPSSKTVYPQVTGTGYFGFSSLIGFTCNLMITGIRPSQSVESPFGLYEFDFQVTSMVFTTTG